MNAALFRLISLVLALSGLVFSQKGTSKEDSRWVSSKKVSCPKCPASSSLVAFALQRYWQHDFSTAFACACTAQQAKSSDEGARAILLSLQALSKTHLSTQDLSSFPPPAANPAPVLRSWEVLGPLGVGKMELDADPTFAAYNGNASSPLLFSKESEFFDPIARILSMPAEQTVLSEHVAEGEIAWKKISANKNTGQVEVMFNVPWNDLAQGMSSAAVFEVQAWARTSTFVKNSGMYTLECIGPHTVYIRNDNTTRVLVADVYRAQQVRAVVDLKAGLVGVAVPLHMVAQMTFSCSLSPAPTTLVVSAPQNVPHLVEFAHSPGKGFLLSRVFSLVAQNVFSHSVSVEVSIEKPFAQPGRFFLRPARRLGDESPLAVQTTIAAGQTLSLALEIVNRSPGLDHEPVSAEGEKEEMLYVLCRDTRPFTILLTPSQGNVVKVPLHWQCRKWTQSFLFSFLDHDNSVAEAAVVLPMDAHSPHALHDLPDLHRTRSAHKQTQTTTSTTKTAAVGTSGECESLTEETIEKLRNVSRAESILSSQGAPVLLTLHGSGIAALSHADAYKQMPSGWRDYLFGVEGFYLVAPSRFGAHNWEGVGELTARTALAALRFNVEILRASAPSSLAAAVAQQLPKVSIARGGIVAGHSMGAHGAWLLATQSPQNFLCALPGAGWIKKEEYSDSNAFFRLDVASSFTDPALKSVFESALSEYHVDRIVSNMRHMAVHLRVGRADRTVHPWFTRRMHRLLREEGVDSTLEEPQNKEHWWWDSVHANDGGVLNDEVLRSVYARCWERHLSLAQRVAQHELFLSQKERDNTVRFGAWLNATLSASEDMSEVPQEDVCVGDISVSAINPAMHRGLCGVRILQQHRILQLSSISVRCREVTENEEVKMERRTLRECRITTANVRRFSVDVHSLDSALFEADRVIVNDAPIDIDDLRRKTNSSSALVHLCQRERTAFVCSSGSLSPLEEKTLHTYGPIRLVYARPFYIVHGTPPNAALRAAMRDYAVYLTNALFAAHRVAVQVLSDSEFRASNAWKSPDLLPNIIFIGDAQTNKLLKAVLATTTVTKGGVSVQGRLPAGFEFLSAVEGSNSDLPKGFRLANNTFSQRDHAVLFTLPLVRQQTVSGKAAASSEPRSAEGELAASSAMGLVAHANSAEGYLHLSRLAWPVIPPMVRAPFASYLPDYVVTGREIWSRGPGGILAAGYWSADWAFDSSQGFLSSELLN